MFVTPNKSVYVTLHYSAPRKTRWVGLICHAHQH